MKKIIFTCLFASFFLLSGQQSFAQCEEDITLSTQEQIDNFATTHGCSFIFGDLKIEESVDGNITNLEGLSGITTVVGNLFITSNEALENLNGLNSLTQVTLKLSISTNGITNIDALNGLTNIGGHCSIAGNNQLTNIDGLSNWNFGSTTVLAIRSNPVLTNLAGLSSLTTIGSLVIQDNAALLDLEDLSSLTSTAGALQIIDNDGLTNLEGLSSLTSVGGLTISYSQGLTSLDGLTSLNQIGSLEIYQNDVLTNVDALADIAYLDYDLKIYKNAALSNLDGLSAISSIGGKISFWDNNAIINLDAFYSLTSIGGELKIWNNEMLLSIEGLANLEVVGEEISVHNNPNLGSCCIPIMFQVHLDGIEGEVYSNEEGCNSVFEIVNHCFDLVSAQGFYDVNGNGVQDVNEELLHNLLFEISPASQSFLNVATGAQTFLINEPGIYSIEFGDSNGYQWQCDDVLSMGLDEETETAILFAIQSTDNHSQQQVDVSTSITRCDREVNVWLNYSNLGTVPVSGYVSLEPSELATFVSANPPVDTIINEVLFWYYEDLYPTHSEQIHLGFQMPNADFIGEEITFQAEMASWDQPGSSRNTISSELICSYDPNDKLVTPKGVGEEAYTLFEDSLLTYTIRFQNTGNDTAFNVRIEDEISEILDLSTYRFISSSHDLFTEIDQENRKLTFLFNDIYLPDSNVNEMGSHGFVKFSIETMSNLNENTLVENTADIFFDFNDAIVTNTIQNRMVSMLPSGIDSSQKMPAFSIYPNPNEGQFFLEINDANENNLLRFRLYNSTGQLLESRKISSERNSIEINGGPGVYFISLETKQGVFTEKIIIQ